MNKEERTELIDEVNSLLRVSIIALEQNDLESYINLYPAMFNKLEQLRNALGYHWDAGKLTRWKK